MFFIQKIVNNLFNNNHIIILWNVLQVIGFQKTQFPTSQPGLIFRVGLILKPSSKSR